MKKPKASLSSGPESLFASKAPTPPPTKSVMATITATLKVTSLQQLSKVLTRIEGIRDVTSVTREVH